MKQVTCVTCLQLEASAAVLRVISVHMGTFYLLLVITGSLFVSWTKMIQAF